MERFKFNTRFQYDAETLDAFATEPRKLIKSCEYKETEEMLHDRVNRVILCVADQNLQERLLHNTDLGLGKTLKICRARKMSKRKIEEAPGLLN